MRLQRACSSLKLMLAALSAHLSVLVDLIHSRTELKYGMQCSIAHHALRCQCPVTDAYYRAGVSPLLPFHKHAGSIHFCLLASAHDPAPACQGAVQQARQVRIH